MGTSRFSTVLVFVLAITVIAAVFGCSPKMMSDDSVLTLISKAVEAGYWTAPNQVGLKTLYEDPGYTPILAMQKARIIRERTKFLSVVCNDNPYKSVWQPEPGTCEAFAAEGGTE